MHFQQQQKKSLTRTPRAVEACSSGDIKNSSLQCNQNRLVWILISNQKKEKKRKEEEAEEEEEMSNE
jgi:hypothetical protein